MASGTLGQQTRTAQAQQQQGRITRTQRKQQKDAEYYFGEYQKEADRLRTEVFVDKVVQETYQEVIPKKYLDRSGNPTRDWQRMSDRNKRSAIKNTSKRDLVVFNRTRDVNDPFTFDEYTAEYEKLNPNIQQFFASPQAITAEQERKKGVERTTLQQRIDQAKARLDTARARLEKFREEERQYRYSSDPKRRERQKENMEQRERDYEYDVQEYKDQIREAQRQAGKIEQGATAKDIWNYADDKARYDRDRSESRDKAMDKFNKEVKTGNMDETLLKLGLNKETVKYSDFNKAVDKYNEDVKYMKSLQKWAGKVGFENISDFAKEKLNPDAIAWQKANPTEKLIYDKQGNVTGVQSGTLKQTISIAEYNKLASKTPDDYYKEWQGTKINKPVYVDFTSSNVQMPYQTRGTINTSPTTNLYPTSAGEPQGFMSFVSKLPVVSQTIQGFNYVKDRVHWDVGIGGSPSMPKLSVISFGLKDEPTNVEVWADKGREKLSSYSQNIDNWVIGTDKIEGFKMEKETKYQEIYQNAFENKYMKGLIYGETDFDTASKQFAESDEAKKISEQYAKEFGSEYKQLQTDVNFWSVKGIGGGVAQTGLGLGGVGLSLIDNPIDLTATAGAVYGASYVMGALPSTAKLGITGAFFTTGAIKTFDPTATYSERGAGLITASISGASLGYSAYKYLGSPVIKTYKIPKPKADLYSSQTIGKDLKIVTDTKTFNKVIYGEQKLSQVAQAGRYTTVTTKWRDLSNQFIKSWNNMKGRYNFGVVDINFKYMPKFSTFKDIYGGIPANQPAIYGTDVFRGGKYLIKESGYQQALKLLKNYGYSQSQATQTLRYYAPKVQEQWLKGGIINIQGEKSASGLFNYEIRKPVIDLGGGIKTRGGQTLREISYFERNVVNLKPSDLKFLGQRGIVLDLDKISGIAENKFSVSYLLKRGSTPASFKSFGLSQSKSLGKASDVLKGFEKVGQEGDFIMYKPIDYTELSSISRTSQIKFLLEKSGNIRADVTLGKWGGSNAILIDETRILPSKNIYGGAKSSFTGGKTSTSVGGGNVPQLKLDKLKDVIKDASGGFATNTKTATETKQLTETLLKQTTIPDLSVKTTKVGTISKVKVDTMAGLGFATASATAVQLRTQQRSDVELKSQLKEMQQLKFNQVTAQLLKQDLKSQQVQKTAPLLRFQTPVLDLNLLSPRLNIPTYKTPTKPITPKILFFGDELKQKIKAKAKKNQTPDALALLPDFTARSLGLKPQEFGSVKDAVKEIKKLQTGFGIRRGGRIKGHKSIDEKQMMTGIMQ